jgi:hypothetical protein
LKIKKVVLFGGQSIEVIECNQSIELIWTNHRFQRFQRTKTQKGTKTLKIQQQMNKLDHFCII